MGMEAELIGIGPYSDRVKNHLAYPAEDYRGITLGTKVYTLVAYCETSHQSRDLADLCQVKIGEFGSHYINRERAKLLAQKFEDMPWEEKVRLEEDWRPDVMAVMDKFIVLARGGFEFYFLPNC